MLNPPDSSAVRIAQDNTPSSLKSLARALFERTLAEVDVRRAVLRHVTLTPTDLQIGSAHFNLATLHHLVIVAIGKAATPMYQAMLTAFQLGPRPLPPIDAILVSPAPPAQSSAHLTWFPGSHPTPDETSRLAALAIRDRLLRAGDRTLVLFLVSGGSSAMVELPLDSSIPVADIAAFNRALVGSGLSIREINILRKHLSAIKGGRLAEAAATAAQASLIVSDVPAGALDTVGSGPSMPDTSTREDCVPLLGKLRAVATLPASIQAFFTSENLPETPKPDDPAFARASWTSVLSSDDLAASAARIAAAHGFHVEVDNRCDDWTAADAARYLLARSAALHQRHGRTCLLSAGEVTVALGTPTGSGGRNQHFCLHCALHLASSGDPTTVLSAGSDGIDGNSPAAGAIADRHTALRARQLGLDPEACLANFDSFTLFDALGDTLITGPTGNNLRDLRILLT